MKPHKFIPTHVADKIFGLCLLISLGSYHTLYPWGLRTQKGNVTNPSFHAGDKLVGLIYRYFVKSTNTLP